MDASLGKCGMKRASAPDMGPVNFCRAEEAELNGSSGRALRRRADSDALPGGGQDSCDSTAQARKRQAIRPAEVAAVPVPTPFVRIPAGRQAENSQAARLAELVSVLCSERADQGQLVRALTELRKALAIHLNPPIQEVVAAGGLAPLVRLLRHESAMIQLEAAWALTNIASGATAYATAVVEARAVEAVFEVLASPAIGERPELCEQCLCILGNVAGDSDICLRDGLLRAGVVGALAQLYQQVPVFTWDPEALVQVLRSLTWLMSALCKGRPAPAREEVDCAFDYFAQVLCATDDAQMLAEALWGLCYLLEAATEERDGAARAMRLVTAGFPDGEEPPSPHPVLVQAVQCMRRAGDDRNPLPVPALRLVGLLLNVSSAEITDLVLTAGALKALRDTLMDSNAPAEVRCDAAWALSNAAAGTNSQAQQIIDTPGVWEDVCHAAEGGAVHQVRRESAWAVANVAKRGFPAVHGIDGQKLVRVLAAALRRESEPALQCALLDALEAALRHGDETASAKGLRSTPLLALAGEYGLPKELEELQSSECEGVHRKAAAILELWFGASRKDAPPEEKAQKQSNITGGSPRRPAAYQFGA